MQADPADDGSGHGYFILGKAETASPQADLLLLENPGLKVYRRHWERLVVPPGYRRYPGIEVRTLKKRARLSTRNPRGMVNQTPPV